MMLDATHN